MSRRKIYSIIIVDGVPVDRLPHELTSSDLKRIGDSYGAKCHGRRTVTEDYGRRNETTKYFFRRKAQPAAGSDQRNMIS